MAAFHAQTQPLVVVSACLAGRACRYDGTAKPIPGVMALKTKGLCLEVCPEVLGGLATPRPPCEICGKRVKTKDGQDFTQAYKRGARIALEIALRHGVRVAVLKSRSPSCGIDAVYDGSFTKTLRKGDGFFAALLRREGFMIYTEENFEQAIGFPVIKDDLL